MSPRLRASAAASFVLHAGILTALILGLPRSNKLEEPPETTVAMVFEGTAQRSMQAPTPAQVPAPAKVEAPPAPEVKQPPKPEPAAAPPPPPPPPPPPQQAPAPPAPTPPAPTPPPTVEPSPTPLPPPPPAPPAPPQTVQAAQSPPLPLPPPPAPVPPSPPSATSQPNPTKNPAPNSPALENTLERLRQLAQQKEPPKARPNPKPGGSTQGGGNPLGNDTAALTDAQRGAIGDHVRRCWSTDPGMLDLDKMQVLLTVTTDPQGVVRKAVVASEDQGRIAANPRLRVFSERAVRAVMDPECANLPLPASMLGEVRHFTFRFRP